MQRNRVIQGWKKELGHKVRGPVSLLFPSEDAFSILSMVSSAIPFVELLWFVGRVESERGWGALILAS